MKYFFTFFLLFGIVMPVVSQELQTVTDSPAEPFSIGETVTLHSTVLNEDRILNIYLPAGYRDSTAKQYPVIYLLDGSATEDFIHIAGIVQFRSFPWLNLMPETIVVGIANIDRKKDFTFHTDNAEYTEQFPTTGHSANFITFLADELQPFIEDRYRVTESKTLLGQSLGGLLATEVLFTQPAMFTKYIIVSPSLWWDNESLLDASPAILSVDYPDQISVFVGVGKEGNIMESEAKSLYKMLHRSDNTRLFSYFHFFEDNDHGDVLHLAAYKAFELLFK